MELYALQKQLPKIKSLGASLVAITPESPDNTLSTMEKNELQFDVLSDQDNAVAHSFGLVFQLPEVVHDFYRSERINLPGTQGNENFELPVTGTYIIGADGVVAHAHVDLDFTKRQDPLEVVTILEGITKA